MKNIAVTTALALSFSLAPLAVLADDAASTDTTTSTTTSTSTSTSTKKSGNVVTKDAEKMGKGVGHGIEKVGSETKKGTMGIVHGTEKGFKAVGHGIEKVGEGTKHGFEKMTGHGAKKADPNAGAAAGTSTDSTTPAK